jgi:hypothetical protein
MDNKKTEKLITAIYLITGFFDDKEPMKWRLRELGSKLLSHSEKGQTVSETLSLLRVAKNAGLISDMNFDIISREFNRLIPAAPTLETVFLKDPEEVVPVASSKTAEPQRELAAEHKVPLYGSSVEVPVVATRPAELLPPIGTVTPTAVSDTVKDTTPTQRESAKPLKEFGVVAVKKNSRQSTIIGLLKRKKEIMIKDVSPLIDGVSEKTIQRELLAMVKAGILKKEGEKRWSRYSLAE